MHGFFGVPLALPRGTSFILLCPNSGIAFSLLRFRDFAFCTKMVNCDSVSWFQGLSVALRNEIIFGQLSARAFALPSAVPPKSARAS
jgi:hypothetical protein